MFQPVMEKPEQLAPTSILPQKGGCGTNSHTEEQYLQSAKCRLKTQAVCKTFQPNEDTFNANVVICKRSICKKYPKLLNNFNKPFLEKNFSRFTSHFSLKHSHLMRGDVNNKNRKAAFTLAEVLITLGIIGVVAAITMPVLLSNVQDRVKQKRVENIKQKLSKVTDKMAVQSGLTGYGDTMAFVQEMSKHMKLAKICDNDHISDCWPTQEVTISKSGKTWEISKTTDAKSLLIRSKERSSWANTVGIVTADGTPMILSYKKDCDFDVDKSGLIYSNGSATSNSLNCLSGAFDWNGGKNPNKLGDDVITFGKARGLGKDCTIEIGGKCFSAPFTPDPLTYEECQEQKVGLNINTCCSDDECYGKDYWAGAVAECGGVNNMPTMAQLAEFASQLYIGNPKIGVEEDKKNIVFDYNSPVTKALGLVPTFYIWSGEENGNGALVRRYNSTKVFWAGYYRNYTNILGICSGE